MKFLFLVLYCAYAIAVPLLPGVPDDGYDYSLDFSEPANLPQMKCVKQQGYKYVHVRTYKADGNGAFDSYGAINMNNAISASLIPVAYMEPQPYSTKTGAQQLDEMIKGLKSNGVKSNYLTQFHVQVITPSNWYVNPQANINVINSILIEAQANSMYADIYTTKRDWISITGNWSIPGNLALNLWYSDVTTAGANGETPTNFNNFVPFGKWYYGALKQFAQSELVCSIHCNRSISYSSSP